MVDTVTDAALLRVMHELLAARGADKTICPSEVPRRLLGEQGDWRAQLKRTRALAAALMKRDQVVIVKKGKPVDPAHIKGVVRLRQGPAFPAVGFDGDAIDASSGQVPDPARDQEPGDT